MEHASTSASWRRAWGLLALLPLASLSYCTPDPSAVVNRNIRFRAVIAGYPDSPTKKVSGTNESFSVSVTASSDMYEESDQQMRLNALYNGSDGAAPSTWYEVL